MDKNSKRQRKLEDAGEGLLATEEGHSIELNDMAYTGNMSCHSLFKVACLSLSSYVIYEEINANQDSYIKKIKVHSYTC